jgi:hypothetical protein
MPTVSTRPRGAAARQVVFLAAVLVGMAWSVPLAGQGLTASLGGGLAQPMGFLNTGADLGFQGMAAVSIVPSHFPISARIEGMYSQFGFSADAGHFRVIQGTLNGVYYFGAGPTAVIRPYLVAGVGFYNYKSVFSPDYPFEDRANTDRGINGGAGIDLAAGSVRLFAEARYHHVYTEGEDPEFLPITVGIQLGR